VSGHTNAICVKNHSHSDARLNPTALKYMESSINMHTRNAVQRWDIFKLNFTLFIHQISNLKPNHCEFKVHFTTSFEEYLFHLFINIQFCNGPWSCIAFVTLNAKKVQPWTSMKCSIQMTLRKTHLSTSTQN
jgi:hypothetical protein